MSIGKCALTIETHDSASSIFNQDSSSILPIISDVINIMSDAINFLLGHYTKLILFWQH